MTIKIVAYIASASLLLFSIVAMIAHLRGSAQREIEFRKAFKRRCLEDEHEHQDQR